VLGGCLGPFAPWLVDDDGSACAARFVVHTIARLVVAAR
jgi:hypothetical protein